MDARRRYAELLRQALRTLTRAALGAVQPTLAEHFLCRLRQAGDHAEDIHLLVLSVFMDAKSYSSAAQLYEGYREFLREQDGLLPPAGMTELYTRIPRVAAEVVPELSPSMLKLEPPGGGTPLDSPFYIVRPADLDFHAAIARRDGIVLLRGPRQVGKTSLLARGLEQARQAGARVVVTDFQKLSPQDTTSVETFFRSLAHILRSRLKVSVRPDDCWDPLLSANANFETYLRDEILSASALPLVWGIDEADALFARDYTDSVFGLFRSWYNERSLDPSGPWRRFTLILTYSTEAQLFITNAHQSPFNVGARVALGDFTFEEAEELNTRYGHPLPPSDLERLYALVGGHPYLLQGGLHEVKAHGLNVIALEAEAQKDSGLFTDHLVRLRLCSIRDKALQKAVEALLRGETDMNLDAFSRLRAAGIVAGDSARTARLRCRLYEDYLRKHLS